MGEPKTKPTNQNVEEFLNRLPDEKKRRESFTLLKLMRRITKTEPQMWGNSMIGFGQYHYRYASGREGEWFLTGFSPRKANLTLYLMAGLEQYGELLQALGKCKIGKSCLYISKIEDIDLSILEKLIQESVRALREKDASL